MILYRKVEKPKLNCLFLPGIPGRIKNFAIFDDLIENDINVYIHQYPGTYGKDGVFDIESSKLSVLDSLNKLKKEKLPVVLIAYSFSTFIAMQLELSDRDGIVAILLFSPVAGLDKTSISENFYEVLVQLKNEAKFSINEGFWKEKLQQCKFTDPTEILHNLSKSNIPVAFIYSKNDKAVNIDVLGNSIKKYLKKYGYGKFLVFSFSNGDHRMDSYHSDLIRNIITAFRVKEDLINILGTDSSFYYWGSSQIYSLYSVGRSDIDLLIIKDDYLLYYEQLVNYINIFNKTERIKIDLSVNNRSDLLSNSTLKLTYQLHPL